MPFCDGLRVVKSAIHGYGVVTTRPFAKGELVCFGDGIFYPEDAEFDDTYALVFDGEDTGLGDTYFWDLVDQTRWFNHSCAPNSEVRGKWDPEQRRVNAHWIALRDIEVGEEITYDYAFVGDVAEPCACGAATCRGLIVDPDPEELAKVPEHLLRYLRRAA
jgi:hypothetical protein